MFLEFESPYLLSFAVLLPVVLMVIRYSLVDSPKAQVVTSALVRISIILLLILSLAGSLWVTHSRDVSLMVLADVSDSTPQDRLEQIRKTYQSIVDAKPDSAKAGLIVFASQASTITELSKNTELPEDIALEAMDGSETGLADALNFTRQLMPPDSINRVLLISDGNETTGDAITVAKRAESHGLDIFTQAYEMEDRNEMWLEDLLVPTEVKKGQSFSVSAIAHSATAVSATFTLYRDGFKVQEQEMMLEPGQNALVFQESNPGEGLTRYELRAETKDDFFVDNNIASGLVHITGEPRVLMLEGKERDARYLARALEAESIHVEVREGKGMPASLDEFATYDAVIMSDVPAPDVSVQQMNMLRSYVEDLGGGFVMIGGEESFGLGGYYRTSVEEMLPVRMRSEKKKDTPSLAMMLIIDKSGSMGGEKIELAKEAAMATVELLSERDYVGVVAFDGEPYWVVDMQSAANQMGIIQTIEQIDAGGGTNIHPAMVEANEALAMIPASFKHAILLTDGISQPGEFYGITNEMTNQMVTVSTVGMGEGADIDLLQDIARWGRGRFYFTDDAYDVPQIFTKETMTASKSSLVEEPFLPVVYKDNPVIQSIEWELSPFLLGYVVTSPKTNADVSLITERGDPLLATWQFGLGKCAAFMSDAKSRWALDWMSWEGYSQFWTQIVRYIMRTSQNRGIETTIDYRPGKGKITVDAFHEKGYFVNGLHSKLFVIDPDTETKTYDIQQTASGRYEAEFPVKSTGSYLFRINQTIPNSNANDTRKELVYSNFTRGLTISYKAEYRHLSTNEEFLQQMAQITGGKYQPKMEELFEVEADDAVPVRKRIWRNLLMLALILFLLDVALRRMDLAGRGPFQSSVKRYG